MLATWFAQTMPRSSAACEPLIETIVRLVALPALSWDGTN